MKVGGQHFVSSFLFSFFYMKDKKKDTKKEEKKTKKKSNAEKANNTKVDKKLLLGCKRSKGKH